MTGWWSGPDSPPGLMVEGRDVALERQETARAGNVCSVDPAGLTGFAEQRAGLGPVRDLPTRDFGEEVREEIADGRNYSVWWLAQVLQQQASGRLDVGQGDRLSAVIRDGLVALVRAFDRVEQAQRLQRDMLRGVRAALERAIADTFAAYPACHCDLHPAMTNEELVELGAGCTSPMFCCPRLDAVRRRVGL